MMILMEGMDFSGKTTLAFMIVNHLKREGVSASYNTGPLKNGWFSMVVTKVHKSKEMNFLVRNTVHAMVPVFDRLFFSVSRDQFIVQETYIDRTIAYNRARKRYYFSEPLYLISPLFHKFDLTIYITNKFDERLTRYHKSQQVNAEDEKRFADRALFQLTCDHLGLIIIKRANCIVINTDGESIEQTFRKICHLLNPMISFLVNPQGK